MDRFGQVKACPSPAHLNIGPNISGSIIGHGPETYAPLQIQAFFCQICQGIVQAFITS